MARIVKMAATSPLKVGDKFVCRCGLSKGWQESDPQPFCDGSHGQARQEEAGKVYCYDDGDPKVVEG